MSGSPSAADVSSGNPKGCNAKEARPPLQAKYDQVWDRIDQHEIDLWCAAIEGSSRERRRNGRFPMANERWWQRRGGHVRRSGAVLVANLLV